MSFLKAENITKQYTNLLALDNVSIEVEKGTIFGLLGPNGAGKTTLIRIINQITAPDSGKVTIDGCPLKSEDIHRIGYLPEERGLYKKMKVGEQAVYLARLKGLSRHDAINRLQYWFEKFEITPWWNKKVMELSKGMQQKVQFIVTVLHEPELLIFDEPFSGFDPINANLLKEEILELKRKGSTIIFSTHNMSSVEEICDNIALINQAEKILDGNIHEIKHRFKTNTCKIAYNGNFQSIENSMSARFEIIEHNESKWINSLTLKNLNGKSNNEILRLLSNEIEIVSFQEVIPSMNDIFIRVVEEHLKMGI